MQKFSRGIHVSKENNVLCVYQLAWNVWVPPGGKLESNEDPLYCLKRECKEEADIKILLVQLIYEGEMIFGNQTWFAYIYALRIISGIPKVKEKTKHSNIAYMPVESIHKSYREFAKQAIKIG